MDTNAPYSHQVHGLDKHARRADWPRLNHRDLTWLGRYYPQLESNATILWHSPRPFSSAALVHSGQTHYFVKRHDERLRHVASLQEEHRFIQHLQARGMPVPTVQHTIRHATAVNHDSFTYEVHAAAAGEDWYRDAPSWTPVTDRNHAFAMGAMLARLHQAAMGYDAAARQTRLLVSSDDFLRADEPLATLERWLVQYPQLQPHLPPRWQHELASILAMQRAVRQRVQQQPRLWTHNDWHASNLFWHAHNGQTRIATVLDFGLCAPTFALYDLTIAIERNAIAWLDLPVTEQIGHVPTARSLLQGYASMRPLSITDCQLIADLLPIVHVDFAFSELAFFSHVLHSTERVQVAWHDYLLPHHHWFATTDGRQLLAAIAQAAP